jgi:hypothetical protein
MAECVICKEEFADDPDLEPVCYAPCKRCDVLYCRKCLTRYIQDYETQCSVCKAKIKITRSMTVIIDGADRRRAHDRRAQDSQQSDGVRRVAPVAGSLLEQAVDPSFLQRRRAQDDDAASRREAERLAALLEEAPRAPESPDAATRALMEQLQQEDAAERQRAEAARRPPPQAPQAPPAKRHRSSDGLVQTTIQARPREVIDVDASDAGDETQLSGDAPPPAADETQSPDDAPPAPAMAPPAAPAPSPLASAAPALDLTQDSSGEDGEAAPAARPPARPADDDDAWKSWFQGQASERKKRQASLHESASSSDGDDDGSPPARRSRSHERARDSQKSSASECIVIEKTHVFLLSPHRPRLEHCAQNPISERRQVRRQVVHHSIKHVRSARAPGVVRKEQPRQVRVLEERVPLGHAPVGRDDPGVDVRVARRGHRPGRGAVERSHGRRPRRRRS